MIFFRERGQSFENSSSAKTNLRNMLKFPSLSKPQTLILVKIYPLKVGSLNLGCSFFLRKHKDEVTEEAELRQKFEKLIEKYSLHEAENII